MAYFYGKLQGNKGETTRLGSKSSGIEATINGWDIGVTTKIEFYESLNTDVVYVYDTKGSNGGRHNLIISYAYIDDKFTIINNSYPELYFNSFVNNIVNGTTDSYIEQGISTPIMYFRWSQAPEKPIYWDKIDSTLHEEGIIIDSSFTELRNYILSKYPINKYPEYYV